MHGFRILDQLHLTIRVVPAASNPRIPVLSRRPLDLLLTSRACQPLSQVTTRPLAARLVPACRPGFAPNVAHHYLQNGQ